MTGVRTTGVFVTGTDTGAGKTLVASGLVRMLAGRGHAVVGLKPVARGAVRTPAGLRNADAQSLAAESSVRHPYEVTNPYCFEPAIAPHLAAAEAGVPIPLDALVRWYGLATAGARIAVVEGAGGWRTPLYPDGFLSDLPEHLGLGVILVVGLKLGCLNHARLTLEAVETAGRCPVVGWVGSQVDPGFERLAANLASLERLLGGPPLALLPSLSGPSAASAAEHLDQPRLLSALGLAASAGKR